MKTVKINDFDWAGFRRNDFCIVSDSSQNLISVLRVLSEKGYYWYTSGKSLIEDCNMKDQLLDDIKQELIYICASGDLENGVIRYYPCASYAVMIDFEEDKNMNNIKIVKAKDFDWERFKDDRVAIMVDNRDTCNLNKVMELLDKAGYCWGGAHRSLTDKYTPEYESITNASNGPIIYLSTNGCQTAHSVFWYGRLCPSEHPVKIIFDEHTDDDKIVITNDGKTTTATLYSNGKKAGVGTAVCHDDDKFDIYTGAKLALERLERYKKEAEMSDWEKFIKGEVDMRVPKKYLQNFLCRTKKDGLEFKGLMSDWYLRWLEQDGDSIMVSVDDKIKKGPILTEVLRDDCGKTVNYIPGMK